MNTITINGVDSSEIQGLLIQNLPPITKPKMRTRIEEIDGKNGDLITNLGFSAYDKEFDIGLYNNYDLDAIISFFNSSGTITFSNESDKYYYFDLFEQIDFEKLIRFKIAKVKMHMQPFKYSLLENTQTFDITNSTENVQITNTGNYISKPVLSITGTGTINLYLNSYQVFIIDLGESETTITINVADLEAHNTDTGELMNRQVTGDYENFSLNVGLNTITWTGTISQIQLSNYSRWL